MIELTSFTPQLQAAHWGWTIAIFLWLVGLAGMGFFLNYWIRQKNFVYLLTVSGILGTLLVVSHLARMLNLPFAVFSALADFSFNFPVLDVHRHLSAFAAVHRFRVLFHDLRQDHFQE